MTEPRRIPLDEKGMPVRKADVPEEPAEPCSCPQLDRADWDGVESDWSDIAFIRSTTTAVLGVPVGYDTTKDDLRKKAEEAGATVPEDAMLLNGEGKFRRPVMLEIEGPDAGAKDVFRPGGFAFTRVFEASWGQLKKVAAQTEKEAAARYGRKPDTTWVWYLTCRHCSRARNFETLIVAHYRGK
jgi:hypothetical protein